MGTDTYVYNGLGLRVGKTDSTGTYSYVCDGTSPGSPILSDGQAVYTPGLSERRNGASLFYNSDNLGNLWSAEDGTGQAEAGAFLFTGFGAPLYTGSGAANASPLKYGGANDCQTDADTGLVLMGHRYYDTRTGRFISQDPAGDGGNWYAYADDNPVDKTDPSGLSDGMPGTLGAPDEHYGGMGGFLSGNGDLSDDFWAGQDDAMERGHAAYAQNDITQKLIARHISPPAAAAFSRLIYDGFMTYDMIGQTVGNGKNGSSGDTHHIVPGTNYSASTDIRISKLNNKEAEKLVNELALVGFAAFLRIPGEDHWPSDQARHIHAVYAGAELGDSTLHQVMDFINVPELNGLRSHAPYTFFHWNPGNVQAIYEATH